MSESWGKTKKIFSTNNVSVHRLEIEKNGKSSFYYHQNKFNVFFIESGEVHEFKALKKV